MDHVYAVILAGGSGTRFWPKSRHLRPKQLCSIGHDSQTMIEKTLARLEKWIPVERRIVVTHRDQVPGTKAVIHNQCASILGEPTAKNTAPALMMAALEILSIHKGPKPPIMISLHADHLIKSESKFKEALLRGISLAEEGQLTLLGITPEYPETGYGYIEMGPSHKTIPSSFKVGSFREKPDLATATKFVESGRFLWNSGLFVWQVPRLLEELSWSLKGPVEEMKALFKSFGSFNAIPKPTIDEAYQRLPKISIDHAVLEVSKQVSVVKTEMGWQDVGSWSALDLAFTPDPKGNLIFGDGCALDTDSTTIDSDGPFVATLGVKNMVVVAAKGAVLVCPKDRAQDVKDIVQWLQDQGRRDLI